ncbi:SIMPL domain-containing protein [Sphingorhabdus sp. Alg239-R122]|uniref:SIMPL domain-containing protein n=1 Tax=Sphingorhabdus sp. Alg239-R122 TaxID=2305989 RepID=UPI001F084365|nr:SIMPL domain-containing protein [Sphingorhabdus sp. Alg239-R122]
MMKRFKNLPAALISASVFTATTLTTAPAVAADVDIDAKGPVIELSISERIDSVPDTARMSTGVTTKAPTAQQALRDNARKMDSLIKQIKALGIEDKYIQTTGININPEFDYQRGEEPRLTGYRASNQVQIEVRDIERLGEMIDALVSAGANNLNGPYFSLTNDGKVKAMARKRAMERGREQALDYAKLAGYSNVRILAISEHISGSSPVQKRVMARAMSADMAESTPVQPGQVGTGVTVHVTYEMVQ